MRPGALPNSQIVLLDLLVPPIGAAFWWLMAGGWATLVQKGKINGESRQRQRFEFWVVMGLAYFVMFGLSIYYWLTT
jgi:hypothetical protein